MISCSSASLIKLCVVFLINISWLATGTAPPLRQSSTSVVTEAQSIYGSSDINPTSGLYPTPTSTTIDNFSDRNLAPTPQLSPTTSSSQLHVTVADQSSESRATFSSKSLKDGENLGGRESRANSSLSKKFEELFSTRITNSPQSHLYKKISQQEISDIIGASKTIISRGRDLSLSTSTSWSTPLFSTSYLSSTPRGELSPDLRSSSNLERDSQAHQESLPPYPETTISPLKEDFLPKISPSLKPSKTTNSLPPPAPPQGGSGDIITPELGQDEIYSGPIEFQDDYYDDTLPLNEGSLSIGVIFDGDYTPEEIAQYIFLTGDETGVASTINDLINDGLILSREETIKFLEAVQAHLTQLRIRYQEFLIEHGIEDEDESDDDENENRPSENENRPSEPSSTSSETMVDLLKNNGVLTTEGNSSENLPAE